MRIGMDQFAMGEEPAGLGQRVAHFFGDLVDVIAGEKRHPGVVGAVVANGFRHFDAMGAAEMEVILAMAGRDVNETGAGLGGHEIAGEERDVVVVALAAQRMCRDGAGQRRAGQNVQNVMGGDADGGANLGQQSERDEDLLARAGQGALGHAVDAHHGVVDLVAIGDGAVARHGPGRGGPDHDADTFEVRRGGGCDGKADEDRRAGVVVIFDLGLGKGGFFDRRPHDGAQAAEERAVEQELADFAGDGGLGGEVHRGVARVPIPEHAEALELAGLDGQPMRGIGAAFGAELQDRHGVLVAAGLAVFLLDLPLDGQAVTVPPRDVEPVEAGHLAAAVDDVLQDLVERMADMEVAVGVGRAVMEDEFFPPPGGFADALPDPHAGPAGEDGRLLFRQVPAHGKGRRREEHGVAVVSGLAHAMISISDLGRSSAAKGEGAVGRSRRSSERPGG